MSARPDMERLNGRFIGGGHKKAIIEMRRRSRERAARMLASEQEESVRFLVWTRDNPNAPLTERIRCALEILSRGELPAKNATYMGVGSTEDIDAMFGNPKLVVLGRFTDSKAEVIEPEAIEQQTNGGQE